MAQKNTQDLVLKRYATCVRGNDPIGVDRRHLWRSWQRTLCPWLPTDKHAAVLDMGCGEGLLLEFLRDAGYENLYGFDLSKENVERCQARGLAMVRIHDAVAISAFVGPADGWDVILCMDLLEHLPKERAAGFLADVRARISAAGALILQTPNMAYLGAMQIRYGDLTHEAGYTEGSLRSLLQVAGFTGIEIAPHWYATSLRGRAREVLLRVMHKVFYLIEGRCAPRIPTKNLLARVTK